MITREQCEFILSHRDEMTIRTLAEVIGCSKDIVWKVLHRNKIGKPQTYEIREKIMKRDNFIIENFDKMSPSELSKVLGVKKQIIFYCARKYGLKHTEKQLIEFDKRRREILANGRKDRSKAIETMRKTRRLETFRILSGMEQKTKMKISCAPHPSFSILYYLQRKYNYFRVEGKLLTLAYDRETTRLGTTSKYDEEYYTKKYGIRFVEGEW